MKVVGDGFVLGGVEGLDLGNDFFLGVLMDLGDVMDSGWTGAGVGRNVDTNDVNGLPLHEKTNSCSSPPQY